jgi:hypothetical protein
LYLNPHLTNKLAGTELIYTFRHEKLKIGLVPNNYSVSNAQFKVSANHDFGFYSEKNELVYFDRNKDRFSLNAQTVENLSLEILKWDSGEYSWLQSSTEEKGKVVYALNVSKPDSFYTLSDGIKTTKVKSDKTGILQFEVKSGNKTISLQ